MPNTRIAASGLAMGLVPKGWRPRNAHVTGVAGAFASQATICAPARSRRRDGSHTRAGANTTGGAVACRQ